jgi:hypothetical protein
LWLGEGPPQRGGGADWERAVKNGIFPHQALASRPEVEYNTLRNLLRYRRQDGTRVASLPLPRNHRLFLSNPYCVEKGKVQMNAIWEFMGSWTFIIIMIVLLLALVAVFFIMRSKGSGE